MSYTNEYNYASNSKLLCFMLFFYISIYIFMICFILIVCTEKGLFEKDFLRTDLNWASSALFYFPFDKADINCYKRSYMYMKKK